MTPYEHLANGIVIQAVADYRKALRGQRCDPYIRTEKTIKECEEFFLSSWYRQLTKVNGKYLIEKLRREEEDERNADTGNTEHNRYYSSYSVYMLRK